MQIRSAQEITLGVEFDDHREETAAGNGRVDVSESRLVGDASDEEHRLGAPIGKLSVDDYMVEWTLYLGEIWSNSCIGLRYAAVKL
jgi:hypothetical protein